MAISGKTDREKSIRASMGEEGIDALLVHQPQNLYYLSGLQLKVITWPIFIVVPLEKETSMILPRAEEPLAQKRATLVDKLVSYTEERFNFFEACARALESVLRELTPKSKLGIETNDLPVSFYRFLVEKFPEFEFANADQLIMKLRMIKSADEIDLIKKACEVGMKGVEIALERGHAGKSEVEVIAETEFELRKFASAKYPDNYVKVDINAVSGYKTYLSHEMPTGKKIEQGELVEYVNSLTTFEGYHAGGNRTAVIGKPNSLQKAMWESLVEARKAGIEMVGPGVRACDVHNKIAQVIEEFGLEKLGSANIHYNQARSGSGRGLYYHEPPYLTSTNTARLEPNMVLSLVPKIDSPKDAMGVSLGDVVLVTNDGHELLTNLRTDTV